MPMLALVALAHTAMLDPLSPESLRHTVAHLASYPTRNTSSPELKQAAEWLASEFRQIPGMKVELMSYPIAKGRRVPADKDVVQVIATLPATQPATGGWVVIGGHMDTINLSADPLTGRAPGANDDASGVAVTLAVARQMAGRPRSHPTMFVCFSGEEQGLFGSGALTKRAKAEGWKIDAVLSNDTVGSSRNLNRQGDPGKVRVFSEETLTHNSRELARWLEWYQRTSGAKGFGVKLVFRKDRFGRGGDHTPFNNEGFTAVRLVEPYEEYSRQHTVDDLPEHMDFDYLSRVARLNDDAFRALAVAGPAPTRVRMDLRQSHDSRVTWEATPGVSYVVYYRETTSPVWKKASMVGATDHADFKKISKDDYAFAVGAVGGIPVRAE